LASITRKTRRPRLTRKPRKPRITRKPKSLGLLEYLENLE